MEIENRIRTQLEAILANDARNLSEIKQMALSDEPLDPDVLAEERNRYHRIINGYRNAVNEVNKLLEQNVGSLSGFYRLLDSIKDKDDFQEICSRIIDCMLRDFHADYCGLFFPQGSNVVCLEGTYEEREFIRVHSHPSLLGSQEFQRVLTRMTQESPECLVIDDVYKSPHFNLVDFPAVVRSVLCVPVLLSTPVGFLVLAHSLPSFFHENHVRIMKIIGAMAAHLYLLHQAKERAPTPASTRPDGVDESHGYAVVLMEFEARDPYGHSTHLERESMRQIRAALRRALEGNESILLYRERELLALLPGTRAEALPTRVRLLQEAFDVWRAGDAAHAHTVHMTLGFSAAEGEEDLARTLEVASLAMHPGRDDEPEP